MCENMNSEGVEKKSPDFEEIYRKYSEKVAAYVRSRISSAAEAEDLVSEIFEKILRRMDSYDPAKAAVSTWVYTVARNTLTDHFRTSHVPVELPEEVVQEADPLDDIYRRETLSELGSALLKLSEEQRELILLCYYKGYKPTDISRMMDMSYGRTKILHNKALESLRKLMPV